MHSRSYLLLEREYQELQDARLYGISVTPISDNLLKWIVQVQGLKDSLWEGAVLQLTLTYTEQYNHHPPTVIFNTIPFHPNVDQTSGKPCIDFLDNPAEWNPAYTMTYISLVIQAMLSNPVLENAVNLEATNLVLNKADLYRQMVLDCVKTSRMIEDGSIQRSNVIRRTPPPLCTPAPRKIKSVSFENYHKTWSEIATSKTVQSVKHKSKLQGILQRKHCHKTTIILQSRTSTKELEEMRNGNKVYSIFIHGLLSDRTSRAELAGGCTLCRLTEGHILASIVDMKADAESSFQKRHHTDNTLASSAREAEPLEDEVDNLVAWTNTLSAELLED
ncbi:ubiquitin-conjugating enzyme E2 U [Bufo bufo]|uniref:ubiquitin-conjugating enzyme E2 U n=1 Tax=Bufo bufo TaxID=8384 RepID=UPI001ABED7CF|nr:ubiquitin-conjugating enzyme E2 U [Bufo bufo]